MSFGSSLQARLPSRNTASTSDPSVHEPHPFSAQQRGLLDRKVRRWRPVGTYHSMPRHVVALGEDPSDQARRSQSGPVRDLPIAENLTGGGWPRPPPDPPPPPHVPFF